VVVVGTEVAVAGVVVGWATAVVLGVAGAGASTSFTGACGTTVVDAGPLQPVAPMTKAIGSTMNPRLMRTESSPRSTMSANRIQQIVQCWAK
ncbi:MAG: hypothetical protein L0H78_18345, partial [Humibacillus sp.]|nr:hypothetical protein [Humibacillus sp.]